MTKEPSKDPRYEIINLNKTRINKFTISKQFGEKRSTVNSRPLTIPHYSQDPTSNDLENNKETS